MGQLLVYRFYMANEAKAATGSSPGRLTIRARSPSERSGLSSMLCPDSSARTPAKVLEAHALLFGTHALATTPCCLGNLLPKLDGGLHVMTPALELAKGTLASHLALEVLDRTLDAFVSDLHLERPALH